MLNGKDYKPGDAIYTFIDLEGRNTHIDSEKLRQWCAANSSSLLVERTPIEPKIARSFLEEKVVDLDHAARVLLLPSLDPIIYGKSGTYSDGAPDVMLIDGHHRYFLGYMLSAESIPAYLLEPEQWQPFQIEGLPDMSKEQLMATPGKGSVVSALQRLRRGA